MPGTRVRLAPLLVMTAAEQYRARAKDCEDKAERVVDYEAKRIYEDLARRWREMAERAERFGL